MREVDEAFFPAAVERHFAARVRPGGFGVGGGSDELYACAGSGAGEG